MSALLEPAEQQSTDQQRLIFTAKEYEAIEIPLDRLLQGGSLNVYPEVIGRNFFSVQLKRDRLLVQAGGIIGSIPLNDQVSVEIQPRVPIANLERLLRLSGELPITIRRFRTAYDTSDEPFEALLGTLTESLLDGIAWIEQQGVLRQFYRTVETTSFPRGRILVNSSIRHQARGQHHRVDVSSFHPTTDTPANRCLKFAVWLLAHRIANMPPRKGLRSLRSRLNESFNRMTGVALDKQRRFLLAPEVRRPEELGQLRSYYVQPLEIAKIIIEGRGVNLKDVGSTVFLPTLLLNLDVIFEGYIRHVLSAGLLAPFRALDGNKSAPDGGQRPLFEPGSGVAAGTMASPDVVIERESQGNVSQFPLVIDVKYKPITAGPDRADLNQTIAYALAYSSPDAVLIHPRSSDSKLRGLRTLGHIGGQSVHAYSFDLNATDLAAEERNLCTAILDLMSGHQAHD